MAHPAEQPPELSGDSLNRIRWQGESSFQETWFLSLHDLRSSTGFWIRYTLHAGPDSGLSTTRIGFASFVRDGQGGELARYLEQPLFAPPPTTQTFALELAAGRLTSSTAVGRMMTADGPVEWNLRWTDTVPREAASFASLSRLAQTTGWGLAVPACSALFHGTIRVGSRSFVLEQAPGLQVHLWGTDILPRWLWFHCTSFEDQQGAWLYGLCLPWPSWTGRLFPRWSGWCRAVLRWDGRLFELTPQGLAGCRGVVISPQRLEFELGSSRLRVRGEIRTNPEDQLLLSSGTRSGPVHCHHMELGEGEIRLEERSRFDRRWLPVATLRAPHRFRWEYASPEEDPRVRRRMLPA